MSAAHQIAADDSPEGTKYFFTGGSNRKSPNAGAAAAPTGAAVQGYAPPPQAVAEVVAVAPMDRK